MPMNVFLHYHAKFKHSYIIIFDNSGHYNILHQNLNSFLLKLTSIPWATMATFSVSFTVTEDGFSQNSF